MPVCVYMWGGGLGLPVQWMPRGYAVVFANITFCHLREVFLPGLEQFRNLS